LKVQEEMISSSALEVFLYRFAASCAKTANFAILQVDVQTALESTK
jgi:hypothetical protein